MLPVGSVAKVLKLDSVRLGELDEWTRRLSLFYIETTHVVCTGIRDVCLTNPATLLVISKGSELVDLVSKVGCRVWAEMNQRKSGSKAGSLEPLVDAVMASQPVVHYWKVEGTGTGKATGKVSWLHDGRCVDGGGWGNVFNEVRNDWNTEIGTNWTNMLGEENIKAATKKTIECLVYNELLHAAPTAAATTGTPVFVAMAQASAARQREFVEAVTGAVFDVMFSAQGDGRANTASSMPRLARYHAAAAAEGESAAAATRDSCAAAVDAGGCAMCAGGCAECGNEDDTTCGCHQPALQFEHAGLVQVPNGLPVFVRRVVDEINTSRPEGWDNNDTHAGRRVYALCMMHTLQRRYTDSRSALATETADPPAPATSSASQYAMAISMLTRAIPVGEGMKTYDAALSVFLREHVCVSCANAGWPAGVNQYVEILVRRLVFARDKKHQEDMLQEYRGVALPLADVSDPLLLRDERGTPAFEFAVSLVHQLEGLELGLATGAARAARTDAGKAKDILQRVLNFSHQQPARSQPTAPGTRRQTGTLKVGGVYFMAPSRLSRYAPMSRPKQAAVHVTTHMLEKMPAGVRPGLHDAEGLTGAKTVLKAAERAARPACEAFLDAWGADVLRNIDKAEKGAGVGDTTAPSDSETKSVLHAYHTARLVRDAAKPTTFKALEAAVKSLRQSKSVKTAFAVHEVYDASEYTTEALRKASEAIGTQAVRAHAHARAHARSRSCSLRGTSGRPTSTCCVFGERQTHLDGTDLFIGIAWRLLSSTR